MREPPFSAHRLRLGREQRGLFIQDLAARAGVSSRSVSAWESGTSVPADANVATLAEVLGVPAEFFSGQEPPAMPRVLFRSQGRLTARQRDMALASGVKSVLLDEWISARAERPRVALPDLGTSTPERAAQTLRETWALGDRPLPLLIPLLEKVGVRVYSLGFPGAAVDAYSYWSGDVPFIMVNPALPRARRRACIAHEIGHLVLHASIPGSGSRRREGEADAFATEFLLPAGSVLRDAPPSLTTERLGEARRVWGVPAVGYLRRLRDLECIPEWRFRALAAAAKLSDEADVLDLDDEGGVSPFLRAYLSAEARDAAAQHLRVYAHDLDAITFASPVA